MTLPLVAMMPLKIVGAHYGENLDRLGLLLDSFATFLDLPEPLHLHLVCVEEELTEICSLVPETSGVVLHVHAEEELIRGIGSHRAIGWFKQQALKLAFARICPAPFYLTLDPDVLLCRRLRLDNLVSDGRCHTSWMSKAEHAHWWAASADVLGLALDRPAPGLNVTPQMLSTEVARQLEAHLATRLTSGQCYDPFLALLDVGRPWTEYTLYSVFAEQRGLMERYHRTGLSEGRPLLGRSVWMPENFANYSLRAIHEDPRGAFFTVCASHTGISAATVRGLFEEMLFHADEAQPA